MPRADTGIARLLSDNELIRLAASNAEAIATGEERTWNIFRNLDAYLCELTNRLGSLPVLIPPPHPTGPLWDEVWHDGCALHTAGELRGPLAQTPTTGVLATLPRKIPDDDTAHVLVYGPHLPARALLDSAAGGQDTAEQVDALLRTAAPRQS